MEYVTRMTDNLEQYINDTRDDYLIKICITDGYFRSFPYLVTHNIAALYNKLQIT